MSARKSPARLSFEFSSAPIEVARLVLMHADTGFLHAASAEQESFIANACTAAEFTGKTGSFLPLHTPEGAGFWLAGLAVALSRAWRLKIGAESSLPR